MPSPGHEGRPQPVPAHARRARTAPGRGYAKSRRCYGRAYQYPDAEITITAGATQAILTAILAIVHPGDEVIVLDPCYDSYVPNIELAGGKAVRVPLTPGTFRPDFAKISAAITPRTRAIIINSPHNPSATVWSAEDMRQLRSPAGAHRRAAHQRRGVRTHGV
jgi:aspartate/methionine/tyrosine aminotransferase